MNHGRDVFELLQKRRVLVDQRVVLELVSYLATHTAAPATDLVVDQLNHFFALLELLEVRLQLVDLSREVLVLILSFAFCQVAGLLIS